MTDLKSLLAECEKEMGPKVFENFRQDLASEKNVNGKPLVPCVCGGTGFSDKVDRGAFAMQPADKLCPECRGRGWK